MQRIGRTGSAQYRVIVQNSHFHPTRGKVVAYLGSYNPHNKELQIDKDLANKYLNNGAQPSARVAGLLKKEGIKLPSWVQVSEPKKRTIKNPDKLRRTRPAAPAEAQPAPAEEETGAAEPAEQPAETEGPTPVAEETAVEEAPAEPAEVEQPAELAPETKE